MTTASPEWDATVLTLYPDMFPGSLGESLAGRALEKGIWRCNAVNIRDYAIDKHRTVDDTPCGGSPGMVIRPDVLGSAIEDNWDGTSPLIYLSPRGKPVRQPKIRELAASKKTTFICGRFEGIDQRILDHYPIEEIAVGDVILSGGEPAALLVMDAIIRLLPGVIGAEASLEEESFENDLLEHPHYTRPRNFKGMDVPEVLLSGNHAKIAEWRLSQAKEITKARRPDLWDRYIAQHEKERTDS